MSATQKIQGLFDRLGYVFGIQDYVLLFLRAWVAKIFYLSGRTKVSDGFLTPSDTTIFLFEEEYALPFLDPTLAAHMALNAETFLPLMLLFGLGSRVAALGLVGMALTIQTFVYPASFAEHATWVAALLPIIMLGAGKVSLDHPLRMKITST
ncbi:MAG: DoxX family protein [Alphaproteobacteria bacterium]|nr:DoxX family protein [Alphaproteobacteria bacterium]